MKSGKIIETEKIIIKSTSRNVIDEISKRVMVSECCTCEKEFDRHELLCNCMTFHCPKGRLESVLGAAKEVAFERGSISKTTERLKIRTEFSAETERFVETEAGRYFEIIII